MSIFQSYIYNTKFVKFAPELLPYSTSHDLVKVSMAKLKFPVTFIDIDKKTDEQFVIYYRHKYTQMNFHRKNFNIAENYQKMGDVLPFTASNLEWLKSEFAFSPELRK